MKYSEIYKINRKLYRYNYQNEQIEQLKKVIVQQNINNKMSAVVRIIIEKTFDVDKNKFEENPNYWISLCSNEN